MLQPNNTINDANFCGIESMNLLISGQLYQGLQMNFEDFFCTPMHMPTWSNNLQGQSLKSHKNLWRLNNTKKVACLYT